MDRVGGRKKRKKEERGVLLVEISILPRYHFSLICLLVSIRRGKTHTVPHPVFSLVHAQAFLLSVSVINF